MARRRRGSLGGVIFILAGAWLIGQFVGGEDTKPRPSITTENAPIRTTEVVSADKAISDATTDVPKQTVQATAEAPRWVRGSKVALRAGPGKEHTIIDRFNNGRRLDLLLIDGDWSKVRDGLTQREGWIASRFLSGEQPPKRKPEAKKEEQKRDPVIIAKPQISDATIVEQIIAQSIANYSGNCPCPFNTDRAGRRCGKRSAYSRPGGASPICFVGDVTPDMIASFRNR
jgi:SH3-like domain-containing protein